MIAEASEEWLPTTRQGAVMKKVLILGLVLLFLGSLLVNNPGKLSAWINQATGGILKLGSGLGTVIAGLSGTAILVLVAFGVAYLIAKK